MGESEELRRAFVRSGEGLGCIHACLFVGVVVTIIVVLLVDQALLQLIANMVPWGPWGSPGVPWHPWGYPGSPGGCLGVSAGSWGVPGCLGSP